MYRKFTRCLKRIREQTDLTKYMHKELQNFKNEIMDDLDDFMSEVDSGQVVKLPEQFDEVVEIVAQE
jgi:hypothetical protein